MIAVWYQSETEQYRGYVRCQARPFPGYQALIFLSLRQLATLSANALYRSSVKCTPSKVTGVLHTSTPAKLIPVRSVMYLYLSPTHSPHCVGAGSASLLFLRLASSPHTVPPRNGTEQTPDRTPAQFGRDTAHRKARHSSSDTRRNR